MCDGRCQLKHCAVKRLWDRVFCFHVYVHGDLKPCLEPRRLVRRPFGLMCRLRSWVLLLCGATRQVPNRAFTIPVSYSRVGQSVGSDDVALDCDQRRQHVGQHELGLAGPEGNGNCRSPLTECRLTFFVPLFVDISTSCSRIEFQIRERCWCRVPHGYRFVSNPSASLRSLSNGISAREAVNA